MIDFFFLYGYKKNCLNYEAIPFLTNKFQYYETVQRYVFISNLYII